MSRGGTAPIPFGQAAADKETDMARLLASECRPFFDAVSEKAREMGVPVSIAVVGPEGNLIALERMDDAGFVTPETAWAKAYTVAAFRSMSPRFPDGLVIQQWFKERNPQLMIAMAVMSNGRVAASGGAAPVFKGNEMVGWYARAKAGWAHKPADDTTPPEVKKHINELYAKAGIRDREL